MNIRNEIYLTQEPLKSYGDVMASARVNYLELIKFSDIAEPASTLKQLSEKKDATGCSIFFDVPPDVQNIIWLVRFLSLSQYKKLSKSKIVFSEANSIERLEAAMSDYGIDDVKIISTDSWITFSLGVFSGWCFLAAADDILYNIIIDKVEFTAQDRERSVQVIRQQFKQFFNSEKDIYRITKRIVDENESLKQKVNELMLELDNSKTYLEIALRQKETENILRFYHKEYEVLPLWYKRVGHLIKIVTGRRSWKK